MATGNVGVPGEPTQTGTALIETATGAVQGFAPINQIHQHLCAYITLSLSLSNLFLVYGPQLPIFKLLPSADLHIVLFLNFVS